MSVKLGRYIFKRIRGRIIPIRVGLERASKSENKLADLLNKHKDADSEFRNLKRIMPKRKFPTEQKLSSKLQSLIKKQGLEKVGSGVDFDVFARRNSRDHVFKMNKIWGGKITKGTSNKSFNKKWPEMEDKLAVHAAVGDNLPDFGVMTERSEIIRLKRDRRALTQRFKKITTNPTKTQRIANSQLHHEANKLGMNHGIDLDPHAYNIYDGDLVDTGAALSKMSPKHIDAVGKEILGIEGHWNTKVKDIANKASIMSDEALLSGQSKKILRKINAMKKEGFRFKRVGSNEYKLVKKHDK